MKKAVIAAGAALLLAVPMSLGASAGQSKTDVCHYSDEADSYNLINVADPAVDSHIAHGDGFIDGPVPGLEGYVFDATCATVPEPVTEELLARAWVDQNEDHVYNEGDALIAEMWRDPDTLDVRVATDKHPTSVFDQNVQELADFAVKEHTGGTASFLNNGTWTANFVEEGTGLAYQIRISGDNAIAERYAELYAFNATIGTSAIDSLAVGGGDRVIVNPASPSRPQVENSFVQTGIGTGDNYFVDADVVPPTP